MARAGQEGHPARRSAGRIPRRVDVAVIGGGPGGSTAAAVLARAGLRVLVFERERFPREHVGESLLPATMPILQEIGALPAVEQAGFLKKWGATMVWGASPEPWSWAFRETNRRWPHAYQVSRPQFDQILLDNARTHGADVREGHAVTEVLFEGERATGVRYRSPRGREGAVAAGFVVDASGQHAVLGRALGLRRWDSFFRNLAVYGYFEGARRLPGEEEHNILVEAFAHGWSWTIPLHTGVSSVGVVVDSERAQDQLRRQDVRAFFFDHLAQSPHASALLRDARLVAGPYVVKDWSYASDEVVGDGYIMVGDAACFVDPLFSSGVHLAMSSALLAAAYIVSARKDPDLGRAAAPVYRELYGTQYHHFHEMAKLFYSSNRTADSYFWEARRILDGGEAYSPRDAFITAVAGQPPQGYERVVIDHGEAPADFARHVHTLEAEREARRTRLAPGGAPLEAVPVPAEGVRVEVKPVIEGGEFVWGDVIRSESRPAGMPCSPLVAEALKRVDGRATAGDVIAGLRSTFGERIGPGVESAVREALAILYVDGIIEDFAPPPASPPASASLARGGQQP